MNNPRQPNDPPTPRLEESGRTNADQPENTEVSGPLPAGSVVPLSLLVQQLPEVFGRYRILKKLGEGGMGTVYLAHDTQLDRPVALKVPHSGQDPQLLERFHREARAAALLHHPNICPVYDVGEIDGVAYLTMAYLEGQTLREWAVPEGKLPPRQAVAVVRKVALALEEAHARGVIHRDLKPGNIMINQRQEPVVMDFGLARRVDTGGQRLTLHGVLLGTPAYMAPEQLADNRDVPGTAGDIYSLGVILYELLTGQLPFQGPLASVLNQIISQEPRPPSQVRADLDAAVEALCLKAMAKRAAARFATMAEFAAALEEYLSARPTQERTTSVIISNPAPPSPKTAEEVLGLLRTWGWAMGLRKLKTRIQRAQSDDRRSALQVYAEWLSGDRHLSSAVIEQFRMVEQWPALTGWALAAQAAVAVRERDYARTHRLLDRAATQGDPADRALVATIAHTRGVAYFHEGKSELALPQLHEALAQFGKDHFAAGRVLDTLGMVYAGKGNFQVAREFYEQALRYKERFADESGLALSHGQLGRLHLDWGHLDRAEEHFQEDLRLTQKIVDERGEAQMYNHLGRVTLARGQREAESGRRSAARRLWAEAAGWLEESIRRCQELKSGVAEGFARKDRALVFLLEGNIAEAEKQTRLAADLFEAARFAEGTAQVNRVWGMVLRAQERFDESLRTLRAALAYFDHTEDAAEAARIQ